ncbi:Response regulator receiver domain-containing protein [Marinitoga hydrogenitolerans DSM 16785]|uniref:Response regulator receiver domain-containing protein n=1 Tax=Marinitoga hydrogenitolerans (strain DSM 16785 / JCM 12826 / AT1271) TaxID=1122195 RepID=A0A1M4UJM5_MARH1|nr:response regulator [Marinitoga hydrogenitolerans]SHE56858.1 Response regulator receiver domain-containing protein [Marinitoga hydrogenitolerans DSM 16785]
MAWKVLIVDDEPGIRDVLKDYIEMNFEHTKIETAENADIALKKINEDQYHVVLLDIVMPGLDAFEFLKKVKALNSLIHVIMITGNSTMERVLEAIESGADDYILKPFSTKEIEEILKCSFAKIERWRNAFKNSF